MARTTMSAMRAVGRLLAGSPLLALQRGGRRDRGGAFSLIARGRSAAAIPAGPTLPLTGDENLPAEGSQRYELSADG